MCCAEQLLEMCGWSGEAGASAALATLLAHTGGAARVYASRSNQYFQLLCRLIAAAGTQVALPLLPRQVAWLKATRDSIIAGHQVFIYFLYVFWKICLRYIILTFWLILTGGRYTTRRTFEFDQRNFYFVFERHKVRVRFRSGERY